MRICLLSKLHVSDSNVVCSEGDADLPHVGPDVSTDAVLQRLVYNCYKRKTNLIGLTVDLFLFLTFRIVDSYVVFLIMNSECLFEVT